MQSEPTKSTARILDFTQLDHVQGNGDVHFSVCHQTHYLCRETNYAAISGSGTQINPTLICGSFVCLSCNSRFMTLSLQLIRGQNNKTWEAPEHLDDIGISQQHRLRQGGFSLFHFWQVYALNETCRKADGQKQRRNQLEDLSAVPSEVAENKLMPVQKAKLLLIPPGWTASKPYVILAAEGRFWKNMKMGKTTGKVSGLNVLLSEPFHILLLRSTTKPAGLPLINN